MDWKTLLNTTRLGNRPPKAEVGRSPFNSDHDKVIFSGAFRRLARKTQVHPLVTNDHIHNRLTHSLEVACVGRSLGIRVGQALEEKQRLPPGIQPADVGDIIQTACLAHDIGNPPFGHTGEEAIRYWFQHDGAQYLNDLYPEEACDLMNFEGNAQGLRVLVSSEYHTYDGGMRLTYASLASFIKYPWTSLCATENKRPKSDKYGVFQTELDMFHEIAQAVGLKPLASDAWYCRHPLVHLMEAADDFCYGLLDLEDGLEMGLLEWDEVFELFQPVLQASRLEELKHDLTQVKTRRRPPLIRGKIISAFVEAAAEAFVKHEEAILEGEHHELLPLCDERVQLCIYNAKKMAKEKIFSHPRKVELEIGAYNIICTILEVMCHGVDEWVSQPNKLSFRSKRVLDMIGESSFPPFLRHPEKTRHTPKYLALMRVIDFVSGMTDHYATYLAKQFRGMGESR
ncbi:MAG: deoxyguanosinetriphosphate triphosphohydrolase [Pseudomonadota bacterium]